MYLLHFKKCYTGNILALFGYGFINSSIKLYERKYFMRKGFVKKVFCAKEKGGKEVLVEVLLIVIALSLVMLFREQLVSMATTVFEYCNSFITSNFNPSNP